MKNKKRQFSTFAFYDRTGIKAHLEKMASEGWMLEKVTNFFWHYRRIEPTKIHFAVTYFPKASAFDPEPSEKQHTLREFCEHSGWKLAANAAQMETFYNENENPVPIETDALVELETIHKSAKRNFLPSNLILLLVAIFQCGMLIHNFLDSPIFFLTETSNLYMAFCWIVLFIIFFVDISTYLLWYKKAKQIAELDGSFLETHSNKTFHRIMLFISIASLFFWLFSLCARPYFTIAFIGIAQIFIIMFVAHGISSILKKKKVSAKINQIVTLTSCAVLSFMFMGMILFFVLSGVFNGMLDKKEPVKTFEYDDWTYEIYHDDIPLTIEDLIEIDYEDYSYECDTTESIFIKEYNASQTPLAGTEEIPELYYKITTIKLPFLYDMCFDEIYPQYEDWYEAEKENYFIEINSAPWNAASAYQRYFDGTMQEDYIICYEDHIVELKLYEIELTPKQTSVIVNKLKEF